MKTFPRLLLLSLFAAAGVAVALGVGLSSSTPATGEAQPAVAAAATDHAPASSSDVKPGPASAEKIDRAAGAKTESEPARPRPLPPPGAEQNQIALASPLKDAALRQAQHLMTATEGEGKKLSQEYRPLTPDPSPTDRCAVPGEGSHEAVAEPNAAPEPPSVLARVVGPHVPVACLVDPASGNSSVLTLDNSSRLSFVARAGAPTSGDLAPIPAEPLPTPEGFKLPASSTRAAAPAPSTQAPLAPRPSSTLAEGFAPLPPGTSPGAKANETAGPAAKPAPARPPSAQITESPVGRVSNSPYTRPPGAQITDGEGFDQLSIHIQNADLREVLELLSEKGNLNILAGNAVQGKVSASLRGVDIDSALKAILRSTGFVARREGKFIFVGTPQELDQIEQTLDKVGTRVYRPNYVAAAELQALIQPLLTTKTGVVSVSAPAEAGIAADADKVGGNKFAGGEVVLVRDYEAVLAQVDQIVAEIDARPSQVAIEAMILSVKLTDKDKMGINWQLLRSNPHLKFALGTPAQTLPTAFTNGGLSVAFMDGNLSAFVDALEEINDTNVIAAPRLMVINKQRAEIQIGRKQGYIAGTVQTETSTTQNMQMLETGTILRIRPYISSDGLIRMEVHPELSSGDVIVKANTLVPDTDVTQVTTNVMVRDGCTVIIGGLMREELKADGNRVSLLGNLRWVGGLFRNHHETIERHELLVLITPRIVREPDACQEGDKAACEFHRRQAVYAENMCPLGKRSVALRYLRLAQNAWAEGNRQRAIRFVELAVHFDPTNRAAIDLRSDIWACRPVGDHTQGCSTIAGCTGSPLDGPMIAPWVLEDLQGGPNSPGSPGAVPATPGPPRGPDRGQPGARVDIKRPRVLE